MMRRSNNLHIKSLLYCILYTSTYCIHDTLTYNVIADVEGGGGDNGSCTSRACVQKVKQSRPP